MIICHNVLEYIENRRSILAELHRVLKPHGVLSIVKHNHAGRVEMISKWVPGLKNKDCFGIRTFWDLQQNQEKHNTEEWQSRMMQLEMRVSQMDEYRSISFFHHLLYSKET